MPPIVRLSQQPADAPPAPTVPTAPVREAFLLRLGEVLHRHGLPSDRLEEALSASAHRLGLKAQLFCTPTSLFAAFGEQGSQTTHLVRVQPGEVDLGRLCDLDEVMDAVGEGRIGPVEAEARLGAVVAAPRPWGPWASALAFAAASGSAVPFLGGDRSDLVVALAVGAGIGLLSLLAGRRPALARIFEPLAATLAAAAAVVASPAGGADLATVAALITLLPGYSLTVALTELATRHLAAGTARVMGALTALMSLGLGVALGRRLGESLPSLDLLSDGPLPPGSLGVALIVAPLAFTVLFGARRRDVPWIVVCCLAAYGSAVAGAHALGPDLSAFAGALTVGLVSNALARYGRRPALVTLVPGIMLLVPGSIGLRSVASFLSRDALSGLEAAFHMGLVAVSLVAGLLLAHALLPTRRAL